MNQYVWLFLALLAWLAACGQPTRTNPASAIFSPTGATALATEIPDADELRNATGQARATLEPFATAQPVTVVSGQPITATARRDGVSLQVVLPKETFWASQFAQADVTLRNDGPEPIVYEGSGQYMFYARVIDEWGNQIIPDPQIGMMSGSGGPPIIKQIQPGEQITRTASFQLPIRVEQGPYTLWVDTRFQRAFAGNVERGDGVPIRMETGPLPLFVLEPDAAHLLALQLKANKDGYDLKVTDGLGRALDVPIHGLMQIGTPRVVATFGLEFDLQGHTTSTWERHIGYEMGSRIEVWVWADDHAVTTAKLKTPGQVTSEPGLIAARADTRARFDSPEAAQARLALQLYRPRTVPPGTQLEQVLGQSGLDDGAQRFVIDSDYRLPDGGLLVLEQSGEKKDDKYDSSGLAYRYDSEAKEMQIGTERGFLLTRFGRLVLEWNQGGMRFLLTAPLHALTQEELIEIAASVEPLP